jgi:hypothetical protein
MDEQRRVMRVELLEPLAGLAGNERVYVVDASLRGVRLSHLSLFSCRDGCPIEFEWGGREVELVGKVRWTKLQRIGTAAFSKSVYQSGFEICSIPEDVETILRDLVESHVERALDEQKANARGVPPLAVQPVQTGQGSTFARHEFVHGVWRKTITADRQQPRLGFTVSTSEARDQIDILRSAFEIADPQMRQIIQKLAELTICNVEGIPMRRYTP